VLAPPVSSCVLLDPHLTCCTNVSGHRVASHRIVDARFRATGLERSAALAADIAWFKEAHGLSPAPLDEDGPGVNCVPMCNGVLRVS
jgi:hypothetical protein